MAVDTLEELQDDKLQSLESLIASYESAIATGEGEDTAAAIADFFVDEGIGVRQSSMRLWNHFWAMALAGKLPDRNERGTRLFSLLQRGSELIRRNAAVARAYAEHSGHEVARLVQFEEQSRAFPRWVRECAARWDLLSQPRQQLNRDRIADSDAAYRRGEGQTISELITQVERGEALAGE